MITITRKVQILFDQNAENTEEIKKGFGILYSWQRIVHAAANIIISNQYIQDHIKDMIFLEDGQKIKLMKMEKDPDGILTTSRQNSTYQILSRHFKGECPMGMLSALNNTIGLTYRKELKDVRYGNKSLRTYRNTIPLPAPLQSLRNLRKGNREYQFTYYGIPLKTFFGKDFSGNEFIFDRSRTGEYKMCDSSILLKDKKIFLLAVFQFEKSEIKLDTEKVLRASLSAEVPIALSVGDKNIEIGTRDEFLHRRLSIQASMRRAQRGARYNLGGKGRNKKMQSIDRFHKLETNYIQTRIHQYTFRLIDWACKLGCGKIILVGQKEKEKEAKDDDILLRNWSWFQMKNKINYKAAKFGIEVIEE